MKNTDKNSINDKRKYFRIDDIAFLSYRVVPWVDVRASQTSDSSRLPVDKFKLKANMDRISRELQPLFNVINSSNSNVARYLSSLDEKIRLLSNYVLDDEAVNDVVPKQVNIGGGGLLFVSDKPVLTGAMLELKMKLLPEDLAICSYAKVISCSEVVGDDEYKSYKIAVEFEFMDDDVRDLITRHVLVKEQALINRA